MIQPLTPPLPVIQLPAPSLPHYTAPLHPPFPMIQPPFTSPLCDTTLYTHPPWDEISVPYSRFFLERCSSYKRCFLFHQQKSQFLVLPLHSMLPTFHRHAVFNRCVYHVLLCIILNKRIVVCLSCPVMHYINQRQLWRVYLPLNPFIPNPKFKL